MLNKRGGPNKRGERADFFTYYMKNSGEGGNFFHLLHEKQGDGVKISIIMSLVSHKKSYLVCVELTNF